ncbi:MAG: hypothetical protein ACYCS7_04580 [Acidimicrobiales bacterium]
MAIELQERFRGTFGLETVQDLVFDSYVELAKTATVDLRRWTCDGGPMVHHRRRAVRQPAPSSAHPC